MGTLKFSDGIEIETSAEKRELEFTNGWCVVVEGQLLPVTS